MSKSDRNPELILSRLEWTVLRRLEGYLQGDYRTLFRGSGLDLADLREYQYGDDVRHIDWNVTARLQQPYVRQYNEDRDITIWFLLDVSPSMAFGSLRVTKLDLLVDFTAAMARLLTRHGNRVGAILFDGKGERLIPTAGGRNHVLYLVRSLLSLPSLPGSPATSLAELLRTAIRVARRRSLLFLVTDFLSLPGWVKPLAHLSQRHEVIAVRLLDPLEIELPDLGLLAFRDAETGERLFVDTHDRRFRSRFQTAAEQRERELRACLLQAGIDALELSTTDDLGDSLLRFSQARKQQAMIAAGMR